MLRSRWHVSCAERSLSVTLVSRSFWIGVILGSSGLQLLRISLNISENAFDWGSALLAYFEIYCKAACMLSTGFRSTLVCHPWSWSQLCELIYRSFRAVTNSG